MATYNYSIAYNTNGSIKCYQFSPASDGIRYFVDNFGTQLITALSGSGIYLPVAIAQQCTESAFGTSNAARNYNNFGGIMTSGTLKKFSTPQDSFNDYVATLISPTKKYISKGLLAAKTPQDQLKAIALGGYCTNPPALQYYAQILPTLNLCLKMFKTGKVS